QSFGINPTYLLPVDRAAIPKTEIGKIQRAKLRDRLERGEFESLVKRVDILTGNAQTVPDWFFRVIWRRKEARGGAAPAGPGRTLVFLDRLGLGAEACRALDRPDRPCIIVTPGECFEQPDPDSYRIDPGRAGDYLRLLEDLVENGPPIDQVIHLWAYDD